MVKKKNTPPPARHSKNRQISEFKVQREHQKSGRFDEQNNICNYTSMTLFGTFLCLFFYADYHVKFSNFTFEGGRKQTTTNFSFSF